jgi:MYXO-CTERM domain-containing protein
MRRGVKPAAIGASVAFVVASVSGASAQTIPAFSGADGAGANVTGGRGGIVYHVTRLDGNEINANGGPRGSLPGSFAYGLNNANFPTNTPRTIVFDVGGTLWLGQKANSDGSVPTQGWDTQDPISLPANVTIAGQTAPGGINILGGGLKVNGANAIVRNVVIAPGYGKRSTNAVTGYNDQYVFDGMNISASGAIVDHVSSVFATDESISFDERANNVTVQYSNISQGQNYPQKDAESTNYSGHALGSLIQPGTDAKVSVINNLYAHQKGRLPRVGTETSKLTNTSVGAYNDFRNNVFYNWLGTGGGGASGQPSQNNFIGNYHRAGNGGDDAGSGTTIGTAAGGTGIFNGSNSAGTKVFHSGNIKDTNKNATAEFTTALVNGDFGTSSFQATAYTQTPFNGVTLTAKGAYDNVLAYAGANWNSRNFVDARIFAETAAGTGKITAFDNEKAGYNSAGVYTTYATASLSDDTEWNRLLALRPAILYGGTGGAGAYARAANFDTDQDGMPDTWETLHNLNPAVANNNADFDTDGYTDLEEYINEIAEWPASAPVVFKGTTSTRYAGITNWNLASNFNNTGTASTSYWQPGKYDVAQVQAGTAVVDAVGQHAGRLQVAGAPAAAATLSVTGGWMDVADTLNVGTFTTYDAAGNPVVNVGAGIVTQTGGAVLATNAVVLGGPSGSTGTYNLAGGTLSTASLGKGAAGGTFNFTGGTLHADDVGFTLVNNGGTLSPGHSIGHTEVAGDLVLRSGSLAIELDGLNADTIGVDGAALLGGTLDVSTLNGFVPQTGDFWTILIADGGISGAFTHVTDGYEVLVSGNSLILTATVPEPGGAAALGAVFALAAGRRRRNR